MIDHTSNRILGALIPATAIAGLVFTILAAPAPLAAQCCEDWDEPYICRIELDAMDDGRDGPDSAVRLAARQTLAIDVSAVDQYGRSFPDDEIRYRIEDSDCRSLVQAEAVSPERFTLKAGKTNGTCTLELRVPGNRNLDVALSVTVGDRVATPAPGTAFDRETIVAQRLYRAVLGREASASDAAELARTVNRGRGQIQEWLQYAFQSDEFRREFGSWSEDRLLDRFYRGLLGRAPDAAGTRTYIPLLQRDEYTRVVMSLLDSAEFQKSVREEATR